MESPRVRSRARSSTTPRASRRLPLWSPKRARLGTTRSPVCQRLGGALMTSFTLKLRRLSARSKSRCCYAVQARLGTSFIRDIHLHVSVQIKEGLYSIEEPRQLPMQSLQYYTTQSSSQTYQKNLEPPSHRASHRNHPVMSLQY